MTWAKGARIRHSRVVIRPNLGDGSPLTPTRAKTVCSFVKILTHLGHNGVLGRRTSLLADVDVPALPRFARCARHPSNGDEPAVHFRICSSASSARRKPHFGLWPSIWCRFSVAGPPSGRSSSYAASISFPCASTMAGRPLFSLASGGSRLGTS